MEAIKEKCAGGVTQVGCHWNHLSHRARVTTRPHRTCNRAWTKRKVRVLRLPQWTTIANKFVSFLVHMDAARNSSNTAGRIASDCESGSSLGLVLFFALSTVFSGDLPLFGTASVVARVVMATVTVLYSSIPAQVRHPCTQAKRGRFTITFPPRLPYTR